MHEMTESGEYVKGLHVTTALHFYHDADIVIKELIILSFSSVEAKVVFHSFL